MADDPRLHVLFVDHCARLSGGELALTRLISALNCRSTVVLGEDGPLVRRLQADGATVEVLKMPPGLRETHRSAVTSVAQLPVRILQTLQYVVRLARCIRRLEPDLVHTNSLKAAIYGSLAARLARKPLLIHVRDRIETDYLPAPAVRMIRLFVRLMATEVIANSEATMNSIRPGRRRSQVVFSPVIYDSVRQEPPLQKAHASALRLGMIGRLSPWKGQDIFLRAFAEAFADSDETALIVGSAMFDEGDLESDLKMLAAELGLKDRVLFTGFRDDIWAVLSELDVLVHASTIPEPFGQVVVEGMVAGLAVVAANAGGPAEIIDNGVNGLLFTMNDVSDLAACLRRLAAEPELRRVLGANARVRAEAFSPDRIAHQVEQVYDRMLSTAL